MRILRSVLTGCAIGTALGFALMPFFVPHGGGTETNTLVGAVVGTLLGFFAGLISYVKRRAEDAPRGTVLFQCPACQKPVTTYHRVRQDQPIPIYKCPACGFEHYLP